MVLESVLTAVITVIIGVAVYAFSQIFSKFVIEPIHKQDEIRGEIADSLIFYANIYANPGGGTPQHAAAANKFRQLASSLMSRTQLIRNYRFFSWVGLIPEKSNVLKAHSNLIGLSNCINVGGYANQNRARAKSADEVKKFLEI